MVDELHIWGFLHAGRVDGVAHFGRGVLPEDGEGEQWCEFVDDGGDDLGFLQSGRRQQ